MFTIIINSFNIFPFNFDQSNSNLRLPTDFNILELDNCINSEIQEVEQFNLKEFDVIKGKKSFYVKLNKY